MKYTDQQLIRASVADLINDYRVTHEHFADGHMGQWHDTDAMVRLMEYAHDCRVRAVEIFKRRHSARIGQFGQVL